MQVTILGSGTSVGVPRLGGDWGACDPSEPRNRRRRASILVETGTTSLVVDTGPDFREQCLSVDLRRLDAVLYTHAHADHCHGIDDIRSYSYLQEGQIPLYATPETLEILNERFPYVFRSRGFYPAMAEARPFAPGAPFRVGDIDVLPFAQDHGPVTSYGFRFGAIAYSTDFRTLDDEAFAALQGIEVWIVDALQREPHPTHCHLERTLDYVARVGCRRAVLTHLNNTMDYAALKAELPAHVEPAHDGLRLAVRG